MTIDEHRQVLADALDFVARSQESFGCRAEFRRFPLEDRLREAVTFLENIKEPDPMSEQQFYRMMARHVHQTAEMNQAAAQTVPNTLRFVASCHAMQGLLAAPWHPEMGWAPGMKLEECVPLAINYADALIAGLSEMPKGGDAMSP